MKTRSVILLSIAYTILAFLYSLLGFIHGVPHGNGSEYTVLFLIPELSGHILFAILAILPFFDLQLMILSSVVAVFIDMDHLFSVFTTTPFIGRPDHSILFIIVASSLLVYLAVKMNLSRTSQIKVAFVAPVAILSHISFDIVAAYVIFGGGAFTFPIFYPFSATLTAFPLYSFVVIEAAAFLISVAGAMLVKRYTRPGERITPEASKATVSMRTLKVQTNAIVRKIFSPSHLTIV